MRIAQYDAGRRGEGRGGGAGIVRTLMFSFEEIRTDFCDVTEDCSARVGTWHRNAFGGCVSWGGGSVPWPWPSCGRFPYEVAPYW